MKKISAPCIDQTTHWPTGCESVSSVMLLQFLGYQVSVDEFIGNFLEKKDLTTKAGVLYGPDPRKVFCGSPYDPDSYGCYAPVIVRALNSFFLSHAAPWKAVDESGRPPKYLMENYIDRGMPVIFWATIDMKEAVTGPGWQIYDSDETFTWLSNEHCLLLVGYDDENFLFNDPLRAGGVTAYPRDLTEARHRAQYSMAVGVKADEDTIPLRQV